MLKFVLNGLAIVFALVCIWQISSLKTKKENEQNLIVKILQERDELLAEKEAFNKEHAARYSRERVKNQKLEDDKFEASMEESNQKKAKDQSISIIANLENSISESEKSLESSKLKSIEAGKEYEELLESLASISSSIPIMETKKDNLLNETRNLKDEINILKSRLENFESTTNKLKYHFNQTTASLFRDKTNRVWLEAGEHISLSSMEVDLANGIVGLPVGEEDGVMKDKLFAIRSAGEEICKLRITHSELNQAVGSIIPLLGKPAKLLELSEFDLYHL